jgi:3'-phosphoadenosine 5'-phosphosulfate sulfotransferase (PAPS reductase)/FAD synthetase
MVEPELPLSKFRWVVINSSGGKDSQVALHTVMQKCRKENYPDDQIVISHQDLGEAEWPGTKDLVYQQAACYGDLRVEVTKYRNKDGEEKSLLDYVRRRGKWPSSQQRYCTSDFKRGPGGRVVTKLFKEAPGDVLQVYGFRAEESPARAKKVTWAANTKLTTKSRRVFDWLPIHNMLETEVWDIIKKSGVPYHNAYDLGMPRLSCRFCIFAPKSALLIAGRANPELLDEYIALEKEIGHDFQHNKPIAAIKEAIEAGEQPTTMSGAWNM